MINEVHSTISRLVYERAGIDPADVEVRFDQPTRQWAEARMQPTINFFLYDLDEQTDLRSNTMQTTRSEGRAIQRMPPRRYNLRYMVAAWSSEPSDEYMLIWRLLATLTKHSQLPAELQPPALLESGLPLHSRVGRYDEAPRLSDLWSALTLPPRPALIYSLIAPLDLELALEGPLVLSTSLGFRQTPQADLGGEAVADRTARRIGGTVRDAAGQPLAGALVRLADGVLSATSDAQGRYTLILRGAGPTRLIVAAAGQEPRTITIDTTADVFDIALD
jgi:Pvc16 N-terminal domain/Carboxypeptidase regulatory-like domain